jgi:arabinogalactan oligomer/maltooligosaccharide transport system permease protein
VIKRSAYLFILPAVLGIAFAILAINAYNVYISFTNWGPGHDPEFDFVGVKNYAEIFHGGYTSYFIGVFTWNTIFAVLTVVLAFLIGLSLANLLNNPRLRGRGIYRTLLIIPWALPATITLLAWRGIIGTSWALIPGGFESIESARFLVILVNVWTAFPFMMCASLGALQGIPTSVYEAAAIDGASRWRRFRKITLPLLGSAMLPIIIFTFAFHFNNFTVVWMLSQGGPTVAVGAPGGTDIMISYFYRLAFGEGYYYAIAAAFSVILFVVLAGLTFLNLKFAGTFKEVER